MARSNGAIRKYDWSDLKELYLDRQFSANIIAKIKDCGVSDVCYALRKYNIPRRSRKEITPRMREKFEGNKEKFLKSGINFKKDKYRYDEFLTRDILYDLYINQRYAIMNIAKKFHCNQFTVKKRLIAYNIPLATDEETRQKQSRKLKGRILSDVTIKKLINARKFKVLPKKDSKPEKKIQLFLEELGIYFIKHKWIDIPHGYQCDLLVPSLNLVIEADGDIFHGNPKRFQSEDILPIIGKPAKVKWDLDASRTKELQDKGYKVLRLWECDINKMSIEDFKNKITC